MKRDKCMPTYVTYETSHIRNNYIGKASMNPLGPTYLRELSETTSLTNRLTRPHWQSY